MKYLRLIALCAIHQCAIAACAIPLGLRAQVVPLVCDSDECVLLTSLTISKTYQQPKLGSVNGEGNFEVTQTVRVDFRRRRVWRIGDAAGLALLKASGLPTPDGSMPDRVDWQVRTPSGEVREFRALPEVMQPGDEVVCSWSSVYHHFQEAAIVFQSATYPCLHARFLVRYAPQLPVSVRGYHGMVMEEEKNVDSLTNTLEGGADNLPTLKEEPMGHLEDNLAMVRVRIHADPDMQHLESFGWKAFSVRTLKAVDAHASGDKETKELLKRIPIPADTSGGALISLVEATIKRQGLTGLYLYTSIYTHLGVPYRIVYVNDRPGLPLEAEFDRVDHMPTPALYFPGTGAYVDVSDTSVRYPLLRPERMGTQGLFLDREEDNTPEEAIPAFHDIPLAPADSNVLEVVRAATLTIDSDRVVLRSQAQSRGYFAGVVSPASQAPPTFEALRVTRQGPDLTLALGGLFGSSGILIDPGPRTLPVDVPFPFIRSTVVILHLPQGYTVKHLLDTDIVVPGLRFTTAHILEGETLKIKMRITCERVQFPADMAGEVYRIASAESHFRNLMLVLGPNP